MWGEAKCLILG